MGCCCPQSTTRPKSHRQLGRRGCEFFSRGARQTCWWLPTAPSSHVSNLRLSLMASLRRALYPLHPLKNWRIFFAAAELNVNLNNMRLPNQPKGTSTAERALRNQPRSFSSCNDLHACTGTQWRKIAYMELRGLDHEATGCSCKTVS
jgi:hypothetical protein